MDRIMHAVQGFKNQLTRFVREEDGLGIVEIVLILVVILALAIIFKSQITRIVVNTLQSFENDIDQLR